MAIGCPSANPTAPRIEEVTVLEGDPAGTAFKIQVKGRGFGLKSVQYNVSKGTGVLNTSEVSLALLLEESVAEAIEKENVSVVSPQIIEAAVFLQQPLPPGLYGIALYDGEAELVREAEALRIPDTSTVTPPVDAGMGDTGIKNPKDAMVGEDADVDGGPPEDMGVMDADAGVVDTGPPDSGLGDFEGAYGYRQLIRPNNTVEIPSNITIEIPVPHAQMVTNFGVLPDGADIAIYQGPDRLEHTWRDRFAVNTDQLVAVARLQRSVPVGGSATDPLILYFGDAAAVLTITDNVFEFVERFANDVPGSWTEANAWTHCNLDRPQEVDPGYQHSYCHVDVNNSNLSRQTLATPTLNNITNNPGVGVTYEMSIWMAGRTIDGMQDLLYFSYGPVNDDFDITLDPPLTGYGGFTPNGNLTFEDTDNDDRTVDGWRMPQATIQWWQRATLRWVPTITAPSLHFRYVSLNNNTSNQSFFALDDWWVRLAPEEQLGVTLDPVETR